MSNMALQSLFRQCPRLFTPEIPHVNSRKVMPFSVVINPTPIKFGGSSSSFKPKRSFSLVAGSAANSAHTQTPQLHETIYKKTFQLKRIEKKEGVLHISLNKEGDYWRLIVGCSLQGKWVLHWGVNYIGVDGSEWDLPPKEMRPPDSIVIKDYAIESPFTKSSALEREVTMQEVSIYFLPRNNIAAINFVLKDEEFGSWYHSKGRNFMVPLAGHLLDGGSVARTKRGIVEQLMAREKNRSKDSIEASTKSIPENSLLQEFLEEQPIIRDIPIVNSLNVSVTKCPKTAKTLVYLETDLLGKVVVHWGVCQGRNETWQAPAVLHPPNTELYRNKALRTELQTKADGSGSKAMFTIDEKILGFAFVLKFGEDAWLNNKGHDFYIPLSPEKETEFTKLPSGSIDTDEKSSKQKEYTDDPTYTDEIVQDLQELLTEFSSEKKWNAESEEAAYILEGIEKLAAEAYNVFRGSTTTSSKEAVKGGKVEQVPPKISSGTGTGFEILCQGFNWESHNSGRWYMDLQEKAAELSLMGFTVVWLPPPTDSVAPEGYMPKDLYNLNSRYGTIDELKTTVNKFHEIGIKVLGDVVLNHRCAEYQNQNGIYNIFGGPLNWDDRAVVSDDPHFQGKGNKSSGDNFHAAPNIDHSQDFVRRDIKEWLCWLRKDIGYDGWRLDYVRGFWGGYVKDYIDSSEPYFAVGEFWDSLSYTYGEMDYNQDAHRQKIIDWINDAGGSAGAFDVTTKGILHSALERCEYWRLSDTKGKPPGVVGWWPSRAVTFIENHDTGSTQGHWRFPSGKEMQGYAYILTHPGTPTVFYDHIFSHYQAEITALMSFRTKKELHCRSSVKISKAEKDVYAAIIDDKVAMKIGPGHYEPSKESHQWRLVIEGRDYKIWEAL